MVYSIYGFSFLSLLLHHHDMSDNRMASLVTPIGLGLPRLNLHSSLLTLTRTFVIKKIQYKVFVLYCNYRYCI